MTKTITNRQMVFTLFLTLTASTVVTIPKVMAENAGVGNWITLMVTAVIFGTLVLVVTRLNRAFPGKTLYDYSRELVGKACCYILAVFYILYFLMVAAYLSYSMSGMLQSNFLLHTPQWAFLLAGIPVFGYLAYHGPVNLARIFELYGVVFIIVLLLVHANMLLQGDITNIRPLIIPSEIGRSFGAIRETVVAYLGIEVLTIMPFSKQNKNAPRIAFFTILGIGLVYVLVVESSIMMVGLHEITHYKYALLAAIRQVELTHIHFLRRVDIFYLTVGLMGVFAGMSVVYLSVVEYVTRLLPRVSRLAIVVSVGILIYVLSLVGFGINDFDEEIAQYIKYFGLVAAGLIPILLLIVAKVKKRV